MPATRSFAALLLAATALIAIPCHAKDDEWVQVRSPHFSVVSDAGDRRAREVALRFEQMYYVFGTLFSKKLVNFPVPLQIVAFRNTRELRDFVPLWHGKPVQLAGLYLGGEDRNFILLDLSVEDPYRVVFHEYGHFLLNGNYPPTQVWFDEGFAEYFSTIKVSKNQVQIGLAPEGDFEILHSNSLQHTVDLFNVKHDSKIYNESGDHRSLFYAQSWLYVHYLFDAKKIEQASVYFDRTLNKHVPVAEAIQQAFGMDAAHFDKTVHDYLNSTNKMFYYGYELPPMEVITYVSEKLRPLDSQAILADVHLHSADYLEKSITEFQQILNADPENAAAHRGLGYAFLRQDQLDKAAPHFQRAAQLDSKDARVHYYSAFLIERQAMASGTEANWPAMQAHLRQAIRLDPQFAEAYDLLAYVLVKDGHIDEALENSKTAMRLSPRNPKYQASFGRCLMAAGKWEDAEGVFERLKASDDQQVSAMATRTLELIQQLKTGPPRVVSTRPVYTEKEWGRTTAQATDVNSKSGKTDDGAEQGDTAAVHVAAVEKEPPVVKIDKRPVRFAKGTLVDVDCGQAPAALLHVAVRTAGGQRVLNMSTVDRDKLVLVGAPSFSCDWKAVKVAVNYREGVGGKDDLVSLEIQ